MLLSLVEVCNVPKTFRTLGQQQKDALFTNVLSVFGFISVVSRQCRWLFQGFPHPSLLLHRICDDCFFPNAVQLIINQSKVPFDAMQGELLTASLKWPKAPNEKQNPEDGTQPAPKAFWHWIFNRNLNRHQGTSHSHLFLLDTCLSVPSFPCSAFIYFYFWSEPIRYIWKSYVVYP